MTPMCADYCTTGGYFFIQLHLCQSALICGLASVQALDVDRLVSHLIE